MRLGDQPDAGPRRQPFVRCLPDAAPHAVLLDPSAGAALHSGVITLQPGEDCGWHSTEQHEELIVCLAGAGLIDSGSKGRRSLAAGEYAYNPPHTRHNVVNTGAQPLRYIYVVAAVAAV